MRTGSITVSAGVAALLLVVSGACGGGSSKSPAAPSATASTAAPAPSAPMSTGATIVGTVVGASAPASASMHPMGAGLSITVTGTSVSSSVDGAGNFALNGVPAGDHDLQISGGSVNAHVTVTGVADREQIRLTVTVSGSAAEIDEDSRETADNQAEVEGRITSIDVGGRTLVVAGKTVSVPPGTPIQHGGTSADFSQLQVNDRVHVHGVVSGATVIASNIEWQSGTPGSGPVVTPPSGGNSDNNGGGDGKGSDGNGSNNADVTGAVSGKAGACPSLTFNVGSTAVATNGSTRFNDTTCSALANGDKVEVNGTRQSNGVVLATTVEKK